jgi:hypothetical protein
MAHPADRARIVQFLQMLQGVELWLDRHSERIRRTPAVLRLVDGLRRYLRHCRHKVVSGKVTDLDLERRRFKINDACMKLWKSSR